MLSERTIINGLILIAGMILGPYLLLLTFESTQSAFLSFVGLVFIFGVFFLVKDRVCVFPFLAASFAGSLNFLPFGLTPVEVFSLMSIFYYLINYVALKRRPIDGGPRYLLYPIVLLGGIVLYHDHQLGLHAMGSSQEGSRPGLLILVAIAAYFSGINIPTPSPKFISRIPIYCLFGIVAGSAPNILTTYIPSLAPYVYYVSANVNVGAYLVSLSGGDSSDLQRNGALLGLAGTVQAIILAYFPISTWWRPSRWILIIFSLLCFYGILLGGYRNGVAGYAMTMLISAVCYSRWRVLLILPLFALIPLAVILVQNNHIGDITLPTTVQRSLSFLPGDWDNDVKESSQSSDEFRADIKKIYEEEYLIKSPWLGNGFSFDPNEAESFDTKSRQLGQYDGGYFQTKAFIVSKNFHIGWISAYDAVGIIGSIAFVLLYINMLLMCGSLIFHRNVDMTAPLFPLKVWLFSALFSSIVGYYTTFGSFSETLVNLCGIAVILVSMKRIEQNDASRTVILSPSMSLDTAQAFAMPSPAKISAR
jgi:MFS family permease